MRKIAAISIAFFAVMSILLSANAAADTYYGEYRQYWQQELLSFQKIPQSPYYEVIIQVEIFCGAHNPPYGIETMTFHVGISGEAQLVSFNHQDEQ